MKVDSNLVFFKDLRAKNGLKFNSSTGGQSFLLDARDILSEQVDNRSYELVWTREMSRTKEAQRKSESVSPAAGHLK